MKIQSNIFLTVFCAMVLFACTTAVEQSTAGTQQTVTTELSTKKSERKTILFFGNSITAGYQLDMDDAFPAIIQTRLDSLGYSYQVINAGLSGETTAGGKSRIEWVLNTVPDVFVLELGANDGLRGLPLEETRKNLQDIVDMVKTANPNAKIVLAGMQVPPNLGQDYTRTFQKIFPDLTKKNGATLIPFILEGVAGDPALNLGDGIHPTPEGHAILAETVWKYLQPLLESPHS
ncbi:MAG: arylesterase [Cyclobacteriaceae bacterium]